MGKLRLDARSYGFAKDRLSDYSLGRFELSLTDSYQPALLFLKAYTEYYSITINTDTLHDFLCDSESLHKRIQRTITRSFTNPSHCLASDFDLESGIIDIISTLGISFNYLHVKSHQDDATDVHLLPWTAQMNVHVDNLATEYLDNYSEPSKLVPLIPAASKASSLNINGETITRRFAQRLRKAASSPRLCKKLMERNNWSQHTFDSINWEVPGKALTTLENST